MGDEVTWEAWGNMEMGLTMGGVGYQVNGVNNGRCGVNNGKRGVTREWG